MCFNTILENFRLSKSFEKREYVSEHWNVFNTNFDKVITNKRIWERMLRNALTLGLNDNLTKISNERFFMADYNLWERLKSGEYDDGEETNPVEDNVEVVDVVVVVDDADVVIVEPSFVSFNNSFSSSILSRFSLSTFAVAGVTFVLILKLLSSVLLLLLFLLLLLLLLLLLSLCML